MSKKPDDLELIALREIGKSSQKIQDLINNKNQEIVDVELKQKIHFKTLDPAPKPDGDIRITKRHEKEQYSLEEAKEKIKHVETKYAKQIKPAMEERAKEMDAEHLLPPLKQIDKNDLPILVEKGVQTYKDRQVEKQKELDKALEFNLDDLSECDKYPIYLDFDTNEKDIDKTPDPSDDFE